MNFTRRESAARAIVLQKAKADLEEIWTGIGKKKTVHWRVQATDVMRQVCLKSTINGPLIERATPLGRGSKAVYQVTREKGE